MMGLIGYQDDVIGFGLTGVHNTVELPRSASKEQVLQALTDVGEVSVLLIIESLYKKIAEEKIVQNIFCVQIPDHFEEVDMQQIEKLARETLGISL